MYVSMHVYVNMSMYECYACMHACMYECMCIKYVCMYVGMCIKYVCIMYVCIMYVHYYLYLVLTSLNASELEAMEKRAVMAKRMSWIVTRKDSSSVSSAASPEDSH